MVNVASQVADASSLFHSSSHMVNVHKTHLAFGYGSINWAETNNPAVAVYIYEYDGKNG